MRINKVYTKQGDAGETSLGGGQRVAKDSMRIASFGTVDELNSFLGAVLACAPHERVRDCVRRVQNELFVVGSNLCLLEEDRKRFGAPGIEERHVRALEGDLDTFLADLGPLEEFILPGGSAASSWLHVARTVCRRAERDIVSLSRSEPLNPLVVVYLNRLSDLLFVLARWENHVRGIPEPQWQKE